MQRSSAVKEMMTVLSWLQKSAAWGSFILLDKDVQFVSDNRPEANLDVWANVARFRP